MSASKRHAAAAVSAACLFIGGAAAETLYVATLREQSNATPQAQGGALFTVDPANARTTLAGALRIGGVTPIGLTGLAIHPRTGVFFGITAGSSANIPRSLVIVDAGTGSVTLVGSLGYNASDLRFDPKGLLYVWLTDLNCLGQVDLGSGNATPIRLPAYPQTLGGGIAFDKSGRVFVSVGTSAGTLDSWVPGEEKSNTGPALTGAPFVSAINSMAFASDGRLYAVNSNLGAPAKTRLIRIDKDTGAVTDVGALPADADALAFAPDRAAGARPIDVTPAWIGSLIAAFLVGFAGGALVKRRLPARG